MYSSSGSGKPDPSRDRYDGRGGERDRFRGDDRGGSRGGDRGDYRGSSDLNRDDRGHHRGSERDDRGHRGGGDRGSGRPRSRSRSGSPRRDRREDDRHDGRRGGRSPSPGSSRRAESSSSAAIPRSKEEEELLELTRDARTVFVQQLVIRAAERDVKEYFEQIGPVVDVRLIKDRASGRSKGLGYVEFEDLEAVPKALLLNGQNMCMKHSACTCSGFPLSVKPSQAEKNYAAMAEAAGGSTSASTLEKRVYIGNLSPAITEGDLKALASIIGIPDKVLLIRDSKGHSRGYAYIQFGDSMMAQRALGTLHNQEVDGRTIKVGRLNNMGEVVSLNGDKFLLELGRGQVLTAQARAALMAQLSSATSQAVQTLGTSMIAHATAADSAAALAASGGAEASSSHGPSTSASGLLLGGPPTPCLYLSNLYDPAAAQGEEGEQWKEDIIEDVGEECRKHGVLLHIAVMGDAQGRVAAMFGNLPSAVAAANAMAGRTFAGKVIAVEYAPLMEYIGRYPEAAAAAASS